MDRRSLVERTLIPPPSVFTAAILAGGAAQRLGGTDKSALAIGAHSILERQLTVLRALRPQQIIIVANDAERFRKTGVQVVPDRIVGLGALGGLYTALIDAPTERVLVIACDMPFLTAPFLSQLLVLGSTGDGAVPRDAHGQRHPLCASYSTRVASHLESRIHVGERRVHHALNGLALHDMGPDELTPFDPTGLLLTTVNTPDDYLGARRSAQDIAPAE